MKIELLGSVSLLIQPGDTMGKGTVKEMINKWISLVGLDGFWSFFLNQRALHRQIG